MDTEDLENQQVQLWDIVKRGIAVADANFIFIAFYFAVDYLTGLGLSRIRTQLLGTGGETSLDYVHLSIAFLGISCVAYSFVQAFVDCIIARLLRKQVLGIQPDAGLLLAASLRKFYLRMLLLNLIHAVIFTLALPLYPAVYVVLRYVAALVIWQDSGIRAAFSALSRFLAVHLGKFLPVWLVGTIAWIGMGMIALAPAWSNLVFQGLVSLVMAYFDFAVVATALVSFTMLQRTQQEVRA